MDKETKTMVIAGVVILAIIISAAAFYGAMSNNDQNDWKNACTEVIEGKGYRNINLTSCVSSVNGDSALVLGDFTCNGKLYNYSINFIKENGHWRAYNTFII